MLFAALPELCRDAGSGRSGRYVAACLSLFVLRWGALFVGSTRPVVRVLAWAAVALLSVVYVALGLFTLGLAVPLAQDLSGIRRLITAGSLLASLGRRWLPGRIAVPLTVPLGLLAGAFANPGDRIVQCDDYLGIRPPVEIVVPSRKDLAQCRPGEVMALGRYPRDAWDSADERTYVFGSQASGFWRGPPAPEDTVSGLLCSTPAEGTSTPACTGGWRGKSQGTEEIPRLGQVLTGMWEIPQSRPDGSEGKGTEIIVTSANDPLHVIGVHSFSRGNAYGALYLPKSDTLLLYGDRFMNETVRSQDFSPLPSPPLNAMTFWIDYDREADAGIVCGLVSVRDEGWTSLAGFRGSPPSAHRIIKWPEHPLLSLGLATGCALDARASKAYVFFLNFGLLARFDYESGVLERLSYVQQGLRSLAYDRPRRRLYLGDHLGHEVVAVDLDSFKEVNRWHVGRFTRDLRLTRDGKFLLLGSTVGLIRIRLDGIGAGAQTRAASDEPP